MSSRDYRRNQEHARVVKRNQIQPEMLLHEAKIVCQTSCLILSCSWQRRLMPCYRTCTCQYRFVDRTTWARQTSPRWKRARWRVLEAVWLSISHNAVMGKRSLKLTIGASYRGYSVFRTIANRLMQSVQEGIRGNQRSNPQKLLQRRLIFRPTFLSDLETHDGRIPGQSGRTRETSTAFDFF